MGKMPRGDPDDSDRSVWDERDPRQKAWAVYAYLCGDNPALESRTRTQVEAIRRTGAFDTLHVAVQWDLPAGAGRAIAAESGGAWASEEPLGRRNTGDPAELTAFLSWAFERCPATHAVVVLSGTGLLDPHASIGRPETDRSRIFTILDDTTERDALALASLRSSVAGALAASPREQIDIMAFDLRELQFLEVAYELEGLVEVLVAPQTPVPDEGWDFEAVLRACRAALEGGAGPSSVDMGRLLVETVGAAYRRTAQGALSLSALDLRRLNDVAGAFDTFSLATLHSVGEELVWDAREEVFRQLRPAAPAGPASGPAGDSRSTALSTEDEWLYDLYAVLDFFERELHRAADDGVARLMLRMLRRQDASQLLNALRSIEAACFTAGARLRVPELKSAIGSPRACRRALRQCVYAVERLVATGGIERRQQIDRSVEELFTTIGVPQGRKTWLEDWPREVVDALSPELAAEYRVAHREQQRARQLGQLTARVLRLLRPRDPDTAGAEPSTLVYAQFAAKASGAEDGRTCLGVSLFRPRDLDYLIASDYLQLNFNQRIHWTALLAVINLIGHHPRALWRILSAVLATADHAVRSALLSRIIGPDSVIGSFRQQFSVLAPLSSCVLSLEQLAPGRPDAGPAGHAAPQDGGDRARSYRVRLERSGRDAFIEEVVSVVNQRTIDEVLAKLIDVLKRPGPATAADVRLIESLGRSLGEDVLQRLGHTLGDAAATAPSGGIHLQLQIPQSMMQYPWELMQHRDGWLSEHFALGRQVFTIGRVSRGRARAPGPLRALIVGNPRSAGPALSYAEQEAEQIVAIFERLRDESDGLVDFDRRRDARVQDALTGLELRELLRQRPYDIIHFAGHATFTPETPERSAWIMSDGPLSAQAISNTLDWCDYEPWLVFANACEAGMDAGRHPGYQGEVFGLASAFLRQGAAAYIAPLWPIDDVVAAGLATTFYEKLLKDRQTVGEALRQARVALKRQYYDGMLGTGSPEDRQPPADGFTRVALVSWAGMVLYGNSTTTVGQRLGAPAVGEG